MRKAPRATAGNIGKRNAMEPQIEDYSPERVAEFLLNNAVDARDYVTAVEEVRAMGLDPDTIPHTRPQ